MANLTRKIWIVLVILSFMTIMAPTAMADAEDDVPKESSLWEDIKSAGSDAYQSVKEQAPGWWSSIKGAASDLIGTVKENGPDWVEEAKEKGKEAVDKGKDALQNAGEQVSGFLDEQQDEFWERTEQQINGSGEAGRLEAQQGEFWENIEQIVDSDPEETPPPEAEVTAAPETGDTATSVASGVEGAADSVVITPEPAASVAPASEEAPEETASPVVDSAVSAEDLDTDVITQLKNNLTTRIIDVAPADETELAADNETNQPSRETDNPEGLETATKKSIEVPLEAIPWLVFAVLWLLWIVHLYSRRDKR